MLVVDTADMDTYTDTTTDLQRVLDGTADRIARHGSLSESWTLGIISAAARSLCPGAAAALVDWDGPEVTRLRAFGIVHRTLARESASVQAGVGASLQAGPLTGVTV